MQTTTSRWRGGARAFFGSALVLGMMSTAVVAGGAAQAAPAQPHIVICRAAASPGLYAYKVNGVTRSSGKACFVVPGRLGINRVVETAAPKAFPELASINVAPARVRSRNWIHIQQATFLLGHYWARVLFTNIAPKTSPGGSSGSGCTAWAA